MRAQELLFVGIDEVAEGVEIDGNETIGQVGGLPRTFSISPEPEQKEQQAAQGEENEDEGRSHC